MDPKTFKDGLRIDKFVGLVTAAPRGTVPAPITLENAHLRLGGYECMPKASLRLAGVTAALYSGTGSAILVKRPADWGLFQNGAYTAGPGASPDFTALVTLGPNLLFQAGAGIAGDGYVTPSGGAEPFATPLVYWNGTGSPPSGPYWAYVSGANGWPMAQAATDVYVQALPRPLTSATNPSAASNARWVTSVRVGVGTTYWPPPASALWNASDTKFKVRFGNVAALALQVSSGAGVLEHLTDSATFDYDPSAALSLPNPGIVLYEPFYVRPDIAEYHNGRVWAAGATVYAPTPIYDATLQQAGAATKAATLTPRMVARVYYSEVIAGFAPVNGLNPRPEWRSDNFIDVPLRVSDSIVALKASGRYLYIFGNREVFILSGNSDTDFQLDSLGDSIGAASAASVQRLGQSIYYVSGSGVMRLTGGQSEDLGDPVADLTGALNPATLTATVDHTREVYYLSDGLTTLAYNNRDSGWSTRTVDGGTQRLVYGGGTPFSTFTGGLYSLGGETDAGGQRPTLLPMKVIWPPMDLGDNWSRKGWAAVSVTVDSDAAGVVENLSAITDQDPLGDQPARPGPQNVTAGVRSYRWHNPNSAGLALAPGVLLTPSAAARRVMLRPVLSAKVGGATEATVNG